MHVATRACQHGSVARFANFGIDHERAQSCGTRGPRRRTRGTPRLVRHRHHVGGVRRGCHSALPFRSCAWPAVAGICRIALKPAIDHERSGRTASTHRASPRRPARCTRGLTSGGRVPRVRGRRRTRRPRLGASADGRVHTRGRARRPWGTRCSRRRRRSRTTRGDGQHAEDSAGRSSLPRFSGIHRQRPSPLARCARWKASFT